MTAPRVHVVTGAGQGIGAEVARLLAERGDRLVLLARSRERADDLVRRFPGAGTVVADLARPEDLAEALPGQGLPAEVDSLIHVAGVVDLGPVATLPIAVWQETLAVNLVSAAELTRLLLPALRRRRGTVLFVNSGAGLRANPEWSAYAASKFGLRALADALRAEETPHGVRVTSVYPGRTATQMQRKVHEHEGKEYDASAWADPATVAASVVHALDTPRDAEITDLSVRPGP